ncbi:MAG: prepilin peptidase [Thermoleophilia bacterium]|nr:prepilin peptidase [Thermoleophilia bacterium]
MQLELTTAGILVVALFGLLVGSFLNVVIVRRGRLDWQERGSLDGRSACPNCGHHISWYENLPLISWLALRGRCRSCKQRISARYPLVEALTAVLWGCVAAAAGSVGDLVTGVVFVSVLVPVTFIDLDIQIIPDEINYVAIFAGFACSLGFGPQPRFVAQEWWWVEVIVAALGAAGFLLLPAIVTRGKGMGMGDIKLAVALGAFLGAPVAVGLFAGFLLGLLPSIYLLVTRGMAKGRKSKIPFGPFLALGGVFGWFAGADLLDAYLRLGA